MNVQVVSHLFPNQAEPLKGVFVSEFAAAMSQLVPTGVIAPLPYIPWVRSYADVPQQTQVGTLLIHHPRYLALPNSLFAQRWRTYCFALKPVWNGLPCRPDLVHLHWVYPDGLATLPYVRGSGTKVVATIHGYNAMGYFSTPRHQKLFGKTLRQLDQIIAVSDDLKTKLIDTFSLPSGKITVIHNGIDLSKFNPCSRDEARRSLGIPINQRVLITVARLSEEKALDRMINAFSRLRRLDLALYIVGDGPLQGALQKQIDQAALDNRVFLVGGVEHSRLNDWFCAADLFCLSSLHEGCPVVVHEALACGIPVVSTRVGAVPEVVGSNKHGLLCRPNDVDQLSAHISTALAMTWDSAAIAAHGREFTWAKVAQKTLHVYQTALA